MDKYKQITLVFVVALFLRIFLLGSLPIGFHADEVRAGWNAYSVLKTGMDDRGNLLALYYNTFGDYRPTGIFYTIIPSIKILGLNEFAVRFPSALFGAMTVFPLYFIAHVLTRSHKISIISAIFLALSPWHISVSRSTSEAVISMFFALAALSLLLHAIKFSRPKYVLFFTFLLALSYFFYHSVRLLAPLFVIVTAFHFRKEIRKSQLQLPVYLSIIVLLTLTFTLVVASAGRERLTQISIARSGEVEKVLAAADTATIKTPLDSKFMVFTTRFINEYSKYFTFEFLVGQGKPVRYASPDAGLITYVEVFFLIAGVVISIQKRKNGLLIIFLLLAPLPAALTSEDSPNLHRSLFMVPFIAIFAAETVSYLNNNGLLKKLLLRSAVFFYILSLFHFGISYQTRAQNILGHSRNFTAKELAIYLGANQDVGHIVVTNDPDDPYPWFAFFNKLDPGEFNAFAIERKNGPWRYNNITFTQKECPSGDVFPGKTGELLSEDILVIDGFKCAVESKIKDGMKAKVVKQILNPNSSTGYTVWEPISE